MTNNHLRLNDLRRSDLPEGRYELTRSPVRIGRGPRCEIRLHFDGIADVQAILRRDGENWQIYPVGPAQGCLIAQKPLTDAVLLSPGTAFVIGHVRFELGDSNSIPQPQPSATEDAKQSAQIPDFQSETSTLNHNLPADIVEETTSTEFPVEEATAVELAAEPSPIQSEFEPAVPEVITQPEPLSIQSDASTDCPQYHSATVESSVLQLTTSIESEPAFIEPTQMEESQVDGEHSRERLNAHGNPLIEQLMSRTPSIFQKPLPEPVNSVSKSTLLAITNYDESGLRTEPEALRKSPKIPKLSPSSNLDETFTSSNQQQVDSTLKDSSRKTSRSSATTLKSLSEWADDFSRRYQSASLPTTAIAISPNIASILDQNEFQPTSAIPIHARETNSKLLESVWVDQHSDTSAEQINNAFPQPISSVDECSTTGFQIHFEISEPIPANVELEENSTDSLTILSEIQLSDESLEHDNSLEAEASSGHVEELYQSNALIASESCSGTDSPPSFASDCNPEPEILQDQESILIEHVSQSVSVELDHSADSAEDLLESAFLQDHVSFQFACLESADCENGQQEHEITQVSEVDHTNDSLGMSDFIESRINALAENPGTGPIALQGVPHAPHFLQPRTTSLDFEDWLDSVGSILESVSRETNEPEVIPQQIPEHDAIDPPIQLESESVEILLNTTINDPDSDELSHHLVDEKIIDQNDILKATPTDDQPASEVPPLDLAEIVSGNVLNNEDSENRVEGQWPSVGDILKWSASRTGTPPFQQSSNHEMAKSQPESLEPDQFLRINLPMAMFMGVFLAFGSIGLLGLAWKISVQDNLTQSVISSVLSASKAGQAPRLPAKSLESLSQHQPWWQITSDQIWWRATFLKMRESGGLVVTQPSEVLAERALQNNPLLPAGRLWKASSSGVEDNPNLWGHLSRDVISMTMAADHYRRIGDDQLANQADRNALDLATSPEQLFRLRKVEFDSELGTERFLLPGQLQALVIMKRLVKEPDPIKTIMSVLPENKPVVWLTAAQLIRQNGLGDPSDLIKRVLDAVPDSQDALLEAQRLTMAIRAEALAMNQQTPEAIEVYKKLTQQSPASDWARSWYFNLGELNSRNQKLDEALVSWRKARGEDPNHQVDRHAIQATRSFASSVSSPVIGNASTTIRAN